MNDKDRSAYTYNDWCEETAAISDARERHRFQMQYADEIQAAAERDQESVESRQQSHQEDLRRRQSKTRRELAQQLAEERIESMREEPHAIPAEWIIDGSWVELSPAEWSICVVLYALLPGSGKWKWIPRYHIADLSNYTEETVSRATSTLAREGWIQKKTHWDQKELKKRVYYRLPPAGPRKPKR